MGGVTTRGGRIRHSPITPAPEPCIGRSRLVVGQSHGRQHRRRSELVPAPVASGKGSGQSAVVGRRPAQTRAVAGAAPRNRARESLAANSTQQLLTNAERRTSSRAE